MLLTRLELQHVDEMWLKWDSMLILGLDPGLLRTGYACLEVDPTAAFASPLLVEAGVFRLKREQSIHLRLVELERDLLELFGRYRPTAACVESLFSHVVHPRTAILMAHARGVILLAVARAELKLLELPPAEVKKSVTGNGRATKEQVQHAVSAMLGLSGPPDPPDVADAMAVALCGSRRLVDPFEARVVAGPSRGRSSPLAP